MYNPVAACRPEDKCVCSYKLSCYVMQPYEIMLGNVTNDDHYFH